MSLKTFKFVDISYNLHFTSVYPVYSITVMLYIVVTMMAVQIFWGS